MTSIPTPDGNGILFKECQRFKQIWIWGLLIGLNILFIAGFIKQVINGEPFGDKPMTDTGLWVALGISFLLTSLFLCSKLETLIKKDGIYVRLFPFHLSYKFLPWQNISSAIVRKYNPLLEYGGWGLRIGFRGKAYNISGNQGIQLVFNNGKKLLIGTNKPVEVEAVLNKILRGKLHA